MDDPVPQAECDGCGGVMTFSEYADHHCPAYLHSEFDNPLKHKLASAEWKVPAKMRGELHAVGSVVTPKLVWWARLLRWIRSW